MLSKLYWNGYFGLRGIRKHWAGLDGFNVASPEERRKILAERLFDQIQYFGNRADALPEWREAANVNDPKRLWDIWASLPVLDKQTLQTRFRPEEIRDRYNVRGVINATGGSTGEPTRFLWDHQANAKRSAAAFYCWHQFGWVPGMPTLALWGSPRDLGRAESRLAAIRQRVRNTVLVNGFSFDDETVAEVLRYFREHRQVAMYGYSGLLNELASVCRARNIDLPSDKIRCAWNGGEAITERQSANFESVFGTPIQNLYGGREFGAMAFRSSGSNYLRILRPFLYLEVVDDSGLPCSPGQSGRVLVTTLTGRGTPFLRYEIGDMATYSAENCDESGISALDSVDGRISGMVRLKHGRLVHSIFWGMLFKEFQGIDQFQIRQNKDLDISISFVGDGLAAEDAQKLTALLRNTLQETPFSVQWVDQLPLTSQGKRIQVHSEAGYGG